MLTGCLISQDLSDTQYRQFRQGLPSLIGLAAFQLVAWKFFEKVFHLRKLTYIACASVITIFILHGLSAFKILFIMWINKQLVKHVAGRPYLAPACIWMLNLAVLFSNEIYDGYRFSSIHSALSFLDTGPYRGLVPRWHISFNISVLRLISYGLEKHRWKLDGSDPTTNETKPSELYTAYILYTPLYIAGPIMLYDDFVKQIYTPTTIRVRYILTYLVRFLISLLTMEVVLHHIYVVAIKDAKDASGRPAWQGYSPAQLCMIGYWNLIVIWLKLLLPWRFFRLWALIEGIDSPENMVRCMSNNYSVMGFWRSWHRSYNLWIVRYIYVPIGGNKRPVLATVCVFTFVAFWHDLTLRLLTWGWLISLFLLPELLAKRIVKSSKVDNKSWYRHLAAAGGVANMLLMMSGNLLGFALGIDGTRHLVQETFSSFSGLAFVLLACAVMFAQVHFMFEYREEERRNDIERKL